MYNKAVEKSQEGFTLIELMVVVVIIGILSMIALPAYNDSVAKGRRTDAKSTLAAIAAKQEQYYMDNKKYTADFTKLGYSASTNIDSIDGHYTISASVLTDIQFTLTAAPVASDTSCGSFTLNHEGTRGVTGSSGADLCW